MFQGPPFGHYLINRFVPHECFIDLHPTKYMSGTGRNKSENITASKMITFFAAFELKRGF